ncbi:hypothetical protein JCGZ_05985 [Jatropha curcas]|uniref:Uncharacterized protein n=1 Tax=Jatropha curcas TaxID=180498 RepID=A0A067KMT0_JATCU|nr:hypothetical protein JCGZ_05985 [Jatropha curcas]
MAIENVADWLLGDTVINPMTCPMSHGMKLWEFILDAGTSISLRHDLPSYLYRGTIEIWACEHKVLPMPSLFGFEGGVNARTLPRSQAWRYSRRYSHTTSNIWMFRQLLNGLSWDRDIAAAQRGSSATDHQAAFVADAYAVFAWTQLLIYVPPPTEFDPFAERVDTVPPSSQGRRMWCDGCAGHGAGCQPVIVEETEESGSEDSEETTSNMS